MKLKIYITTFCFAVLLLSCKKDIEPALPGGTAAAGVNFLASSDVFLKYSSGGVGIFLDTVANNKKFINSEYSSLPHFNLIDYSRQLEFPKVYLKDQGPLFLSYPAGTHRWLFSYMIADKNGLTNSPLTDLADTSIEMGPNTETCFYLGDGPVTENTVPKYKILTIPAGKSLKVENGSVALRLVHLSPDADELQCSLVKADGSLSQETLPQNLKYGQFTQYLMLNTKEARNNSLQLRLVSKTTGQVLIYTGIPAIEGHAYTLLVQGFQKNHQLNLPVGRNADGTINYQNTAIEANLRALIRQIF